MHFKIPPPCLLLILIIQHPGKVTLGEAAEASGLSKRAFIETLGIYGISVFNLDAEELASDLQNA